MSKDPLARVAVALDSADREEIGRWARLFGPRAGVLKVGLETFVRWGPAIVEEVRREARALFLDLKLHDIPNTVAGALGGVRELGVDYVTVHAGGGPAMLAAAVESGREIKLLAVTLLTHLDAPALEELGLAGAAGQWVRRWAAMAQRAGCAGAVCSPLEIALLRGDCPPPFELVTPGIRFAESVSDDQRRISTPEAAVAAGADLLVIGRPLTRAADPGRALDELAERLAGAA